MLDHDDPAVRAGAVHALSAVTDHVSADDLVCVLEARPDRFRGVKPPAGYPYKDDDLESRLVVAITRALSPSDSRARQFLIRQLGGPNAVSALLGLARVDPDWVAANARTVVPRRVIGGVLRAVPAAGRTQRHAIVSALSPWPAGEGRALVASRSWETLPVDDDEKTELEALITGSCSTRARP
jgi:hypothetical protein